MWQKTTTDKTVDILLESLMSKGASPVARCLTRVKPNNITNLRPNELVVIVMTTPGSL